MQTVAQKSALRAPVARPSRSSVVVRASAESRRSVLTGFVAGAAALVAGSATAATSVDLFDDRAARAKGFDIIYEARDLSLDQAIRDGLSQPRASLAETKSRVKESEARLDNGLEPYIQKAYWTEAREQLRRQVGTLRFDLNVLAETKPKEAKKAALALRKAFLSKVEDLDFSLRNKNKEAALSKLAVAKSSLDAVLSAVA